MAAYFGRQGSLPSPCTSSDSSYDTRTDYAEEVGKMSAHSRREDINDVLDDVIVKINRITDHLRGAGENEAANQFTREMTEAFRALYNIIAPWTIEQCLMHPPCHSNTHPASSIGAGRGLTSVSGHTWAAVAATEPVTSNNGIIKFRPTDGVKRTADAKEAQENEHDSRDRRVVWVRPWNGARPLSDISNEMRELGAIYSIAFSPEAGAVCIIFQHAHHAVQFMHECAEHVGRTGIGPFGQDCYVTPGLPYPLDDGLRRMDPPYNERRRLTFARSQLFSGGVTDARFRKDIEDMVGASNIERLWLFNTGNATVVFSAVPLAKMVFDTFRKYSRTRGHVYEGTQVSFSHDPCERDLHLVSQIPGHANYIGGNGSAPSNGQSGARQARSSTFSTDSSYNSRRPSTASSEYTYAYKRWNASAKTPVDEEGWQTVKKRR